MHESIDAGRLPGVEVAAQVLGGRYELVDPLGNGGMAVVWRARDNVLGRYVAVKLLAGRHAGSVDARRRIRDEARAAAVLSHPNIAQVHDYGEWDDDGSRLPYVVMELVRGVTLQQRQDSGPLSARFAMRVSAEVAAALAAAHAEGLVHRDIKPANVMVTPDGAKVVDFGIAAAISPAGAADSNGEVLGTPAYLAPERLMDDAVEPASDVYALGVLLYRLLSGESPWSADTTTQMLTAHVYIDPAPLTPVRGVPDYVIDMCNRCLSKDPTLRPSAREVAALLARGAGMRVVEDEAASASTTTMWAIDREPSLLIRSDRITGPTVPAPRPAAAGDTTEASAAAAGGAGAEAGTAAAEEPAAAETTAAAGGTRTDEVPTGAAGDVLTGEVPTGAAGGVRTGEVTDAGGPAVAAGSDDAREARLRQAAPAMAGGAPAGDASAGATESPDHAATAAGSRRAAAARRRAEKRRRRRPLWMVTVALVVVAMGALAWILIPDGRPGRQPAAAQPGGPSAATSAASASAGTRPDSVPPRPGDAPSPAGTGDERPATGPATGAVTGPGGAVAGGGAPVVTPEVTGPAGGGGEPTTAAPEQTEPTTAAPDPEPQERTLTSTGGTVRATCPSPATVQLLSWTATKPYKVQDVDAGPASSALVVYKHGNRRVEMTVTCSGGVPSAG